MRVALGLMRCKISVDATEATWLPISGFSLKSPCILTKLSLASLTMDSSCPAAVKIGWMRGRPSPAGFLTKIVFVVNDLTWFEQKYVAMLHQKYVQCKQHKEQRG